MPFIKPRAPYNSRHSHPPHLATTNATLSAILFLGTSKYPALRQARRVRCHVKQNIPFVVRLSSHVFRGALLWLALLNPMPLQAATIRVGPSQLLTLPSQAAKIAKNGDLIEIEAGDYYGDAAVWRANNLRIVGVNGMARLYSASKTVQGKAIWVIKGNDTIIERVAFHDARVKDRNGAGIRMEGRNLTLKYCEFIDNETGLLTGNNKYSEIAIENSTFSHNGYGDGRSHNIYIGKIRKFTLRNSVSRLARVGHQVKSRAAENIITGNRIEDGPTGHSSYLIDLPAGGNAVITNNTIQQGPLAENFTMVAYGLEKSLHDNNTLLIEKNTFINDRTAGCRLLFVKNTDTPALIQNNKFVGCTRIDGNVKSANNIELSRKEIPATR
jgi:hypothetical protein